MPRATGPCLGNLALLTAISQYEVVHHVISWSLDRQDWPEIRIEHLLSLYSEGPFRHQLVAEPASSMQEQMRSNTVLKHVFLSSKHLVKLKNEKEQWRLLAQRMSITRKLSAD